MLEKKTIFNQDQSLSFIDYERIASFDSQGALNVLFNQDALDNSISLWLQSDGGEKLREPLYGGYVFSLVKKTYE
jgi:hypothetical protein